MVARQMPGNLNFIFFYVHKPYQHRIIVISPSIDSSSPMLEGLGWTWLFGSLGQDYDLPCQALTRRSLQLFGSDSASILAAEPWQDLLLSPL